jgi:uncharacterized protein
MKKTLIFLINLYQKINIDKKPTCVFIPTCSEYTKEYIQKHGVIKGIIGGFFRICRCHPWQKVKYDPTP